MHVGTMVQVSSTSMLFARLRTRLLLPLVAAALLGTVASASSQQLADPRVADLVQTGKVRVGLGLGTAALAIKDVATGELRGPAVDLARELAARIGIELVVVEYPRPGAVMEGAHANAWDVAFLGIDPARTAEADFSPPYMEADLTYLVSIGSSIRNVGDADQPGVRIAVPRGDISDLRLSRIVKRAELVRTDSPAASFDLLTTGRVDARAAPRPVLLADSAKVSGFRVLDDRFDAIRYALLVPKGYAGRLAYIREFIEEAKASGLVQRTIERGGLRGVQVAPAGDPDGHKSPP
jgi:polar amino acid transport system substrate-binding protein